MLLYFSTNEINVMETIITTTETNNSDTSIII